MKLARSYPSPYAGRVRPEGGGGGIQLPFPPSGSLRSPPSPQRGKVVSTALRVAAAEAGGAAFLEDKRRLAAARALRGALVVIDREGEARLRLFLEEARIDHVPLDHPANGGKQARHIAAFHPLAAARIEHRLELLDHEGRSE